MKYKGSNPKPNMGGFDMGNLQVPHWVWLAWVPQLLTGLQRPEAYYCKRILQELSRLFPQVRKHNELLHSK